MSFFTDPSRMLCPLIKLTAYKKIERSMSDQEGSLLLPYDAENLTSRFENCICKQDTIGGDKEATSFQQSKRSDLNITFILDDTTYSNLVTFLLPYTAIPDNVDQIIKKIIKWTVDINGDIHEPYYLTLKPLLMPLESAVGGGFYCRLTSLEIKNKMVNSLGNRVKAHIDCTFTECLSQEQIKSRTKKSSPDLTHIRQTVAGDTLPNKTYAIYSDPLFYPAVADFNQLDNLRDIKVGDSLTFPPVDR